MAQNKFKPGDLVSIKGLWSNSETHRRWPSINLPILDYFIVQHARIAYSGLPCFNLAGRGYDYLECDFELYNISPLKKLQRSIESKI